MDLRGQLELGSCWLGVLTLKSWHYLKSRTRCGIFSRVEYAGSLKSCRFVSTTLFVWLCPSMISLHGNSLLSKHYDLLTSCELVSSNDRGIVGTKLAPLCLSYFLQMLECALRATLALTVVAVNTYAKLAFLVHPPWFQATEKKKLRHVSSGADEHIRATSMHRV